MKSKKAMATKEAMKYHCILMECDFYKLIKITQHHYSISGTYPLDETCIVNKEDLPWFPMDEDASYPIQFFKKRKNIVIYYDGILMCKIPILLFEEGKSSELKSLISELKDKEYFGIIHKEYENTENIVKWFNW